MGWVEAVYGAKRQPEQDIDGKPVEHDWYCPLPEEIPEMYKAEPAVKEAERVVHRDGVIRRATWIKP